MNLPEKKNISGMIPEQFFDVRFDVWLQISSSRVVGLDSSSLAIIFRPRGPDTELAGRLPPKKKKKIVRPTVLL